MASGVVHDTISKQAAAAYLAWMGDHSGPNAQAFLAAINELVAAGVATRFGNRSPWKPGDQVVDEIRRAERVVTTVGGRSDG